MKPARRSEIPPFIVMDVMRAAHEREAQGKNVIHMEVGQPATKAPRLVIEAARQALGQDRIGYTDANGLPQLRERIARHYADWYGIDVPSQRIVVTTGSSAAFMLTFLAQFDIGALVALPIPGYACYPHIMRALGIEPVFVQTGPASHWQPLPADLERLAASGVQIDGLLLASPANPTGTMLDAPAMQSLTAHCRRNGIQFISDEIYHGLTYTWTAPTALAYDTEAIVINSFSKYFAMTGWRLGWMVVPEQLIRPIERLQQNMYISPPTLSQLAAIHAFDCHEELEANRQAYARNRDFLLRELPGIGFNRILPADGAFYLYTDVSEFTTDSHSFTRRILDEAGVALTPGVDFDAERGHQFVRFSYARSYADMEEAAERLTTWMQRL